MIGIILIELKIKIDHLSLLLVSGRLTEINHEL